MTTKASSTKSPAPAAKGGVKLTPLLRQFYDIKAQHPGKILFFRMGDFYEMFGDDAVKAAPILGIALTRRGQAGSEDLPLCGVPYHAAEKYLVRLLAAGEKVVVVEQVEDPKTAKGVVKRDVVEILTPGAAALPELEAPNRPTYLASINPGSAGRAGLAYLDLSTAEFRLIEDDLAAIVQRLETLEPKEALAPEGVPIEQIDSALRALPGAPSISYTDGYHFDTEHAATQLRRFLNVRSLEGFGIDESSAAVGAASAIVSYLKENRRDNLAHITAITPVLPGQQMELDAASVRNLELVEGLTQSADAPTLFSSVNFTQTAFGARRLRRNLTAPFRDLETIKRRQDAVSEALSARESCESYRERLKSLSDIERLIGRLGVRRIGPRQTLALAQSLQSGAALITELAGLKSRLFVDSVKNFPDLHTLTERILSEFVESPPLLASAGDIYRPGSNARLDELRDSIADAKRYMATLQDRERAATGISSLKLGFNKVFGYYLEITHTYRDKIPAHYIRKQTLVSAERYITEEMKDRESLILAAEEKIHKLEAQLFEETVDLLTEEISEMQRAAAILAEIDVALALAELANERGFVRPELTEDNTLEIVAGRHPVIETLLERGQFVPNDISLNRNDQSVMILTGPNMAGKSTYLRQIGHIVTLAQIGSYVPAESATIGIVDRIFTRVGAVDKLSRGQSTFMVEMLETANILHNATERSLILLDEVGRGTSTYDGLSIAWSVVEELHNRVHARTVFATHYHELTTLADELPRVANFQVAVKRWQEEVIFLHKIIPGGCDDSYGIEVARLAGLPKSVVKRARTILSALEAGDFNIGAAGGIPGPGAVADSQISLFDPVVDPELLALKKRLQETAVDQLTPLAALNLLAELRKSVADD